MQKPVPGTYAPYYDTYIQHTQDDPVGQLAEQWEELRSLLQGLPAAAGAFRYAPGKWSIVELLVHMLDSERVFMYRCMRIARGDLHLSFHGFDENDWIAGTDFSYLSLPQVLEEYAAVRQASLAQFRNLPPGCWDNAGRANDQPVTVRAFPFILAGHEAHHLHILKTRYLPAL